MYSKHNGEEEVYVLLFLFKVVMWYSKNTWNALQIMLQYLLITTLPKLQSSKYACLAYNLARHTDQDLYSFLSLLKAFSLVLIPKCTLKICKMICCWNISTRPHGSAKCFLVYTERYFNLGMSVLNFYFHPEQQIHHFHVVVYKTFFCHVVQCHLCQVFLLDLYAVYMQI